MNILLITKLFPTGRDWVKEKVTHALYNVAKYWIGSNKIMVVRPFHLLERSNNYIINRSIQVNDSVPIKDIRIFNYRDIKSINNFLIHQQFKPDVIIAHMTFSIIIGYYLSKQLKVPLIAGIHNTDLLILNPTKLLYKIL